MIKFRKARWRNFLCTGPDWVEIDFELSKTTLIVGKNGHGKSQVIDVLGLCLFNKPFRKINKDKFVNTISGKNCEMEVEFSDGRHEYKVTRGIKPGYFEVFEDGVEWDREDSKYHQERLEKVLGFKHKTFFQIAVLGSAKYKAFMELIASERRTVVEDMLDIQMFTAMNLVLREVISLSTEKITKAENETRLVRQKVELQKKHLAQLQENHDADRKQLLQDIALTKDQVKFNQSEVARLKKFVDMIPVGQAEIDRIDGVIDFLESKHQDIKREMASLQKQIDFYSKNDSCPTCRQPIDFAFKRNEIAHKSGSLSAAEEEILRVDTERTKAAEAKWSVDNKFSKLQEHAKKVEWHRQTIRAAEQTLARFDSELKRLQTKSTVQVDAAQIGKDQDYLDKLELELTHLKEEHALYLAAGALLKDDGIKSIIIHQYVPVINKLINKYLASLEFSVGFEIDENFEEKVTSRNRESFVYDSFSEGQKARINLALLFAWRELARIRNSSATNLLIFDEILDGSMDSDGVDELMKSINQLTPDEHIFIMSHRGDQLVDKFSDVIRFELVKSFSEMTREGAR